MCYCYLCVIENRQKRGKETKFQNPPKKYMYIHPHGSKDDDGSLCEYFLLHAALVPLKGPAARGRRGCRTRPPPPHRQLPPPESRTTRCGPRWSPVDGGAPVYPAPISRAGRRGQWPSWRGARCRALGPSIAAYGSTAGCCRVGRRGSR